MNKTTLIAIIIAVAALLITITVFVSRRDDSGNKTDSSSQVQGDVTTNEGNEQFDIEIEMSNFKYSETLIEIAPGETKKVKVTTKSGSHDFVIDEFNVDSGVINRGGSRIVEISVPADAEKGDYEFYCSVMDHRSLGMVGTLRVK